MGGRESYLNIRENRILTGLFLVLFGLVLTGLFYIFSYYIFTFLFAAMLYLLLKPVDDRLFSLVKRRSISSAVIVVFVFLLIFVPFFYIMASLADQTYHLYVFIQEKINAGVIRDIQQSEIFQYILRFIDVKETDLIQKSISMVRESVFSVFKSVTAFISFPLHFTAKFFFMILMLFFLLKDGANMGAMVYRVLPFPMDIEQEVAERLKKVIKVLIAGNLFIMSLQGFMLGLGLFIAGFSAPLLWGTIGSILSLIPVIGTTLIWLPSVIYLVVTKSYFMAVFVGVWSLFWYFILENLLKPIIFGETLSFHPVVFFFLLLGSLQTFSLAGVLIGPILLTLFYSLWEIYKVLDLYNPSMWPWRKDNGKPETQP